MAQRNHEIAEEGTSRYHGIWMTRTMPLAYRVLPKCGCTSIMQVMHHIDHGILYDDIDHNRKNVPILKSNGGKNDAEIGRQFAEQEIFSFTFVRNPYRRLLSSFADKILGYQHNGRRYAHGRYHKRLAKYGVTWGPDSNIADNFKGFVRFAGDTIETRKPSPADIHWMPCSAFLRRNFLKTPGWRLNFVGQIEHFQRDLDTAMRLAGVTPDRIPDRIPRENTTSLPPLPIRDFYGPKEVAIMRRVYADDFELFGYGPDPERPAPARGIDVAAVAERLGSPRRINPRHDLPARRRVRA